jgi:hypothetical protein
VYRSRADARLPILASVQAPFLAVYRSRAVARLPIHASAEPPSARRHRRGIIDRLTAVVRGPPRGDNAVPRFDRLSGRHPCRHCAPERNVFSGNILFPNAAIQAVGILPPNVRGLAIQASGHGPTPEPLPASSAPAAARPPSAGLYPGGIVPPIPASTRSPSRLKICGGGFANHRPPAIAGAANVLRTPPARPPKSHQLPPSPNQAPASL